ALSNSYSVLTHKACPNLNFPASSAAISLILACVSGVRIEASTDSRGSTPLRNRSKIFSEFGGGSSSIRSCSDPNVGTGSDPLLASQKLSNFSKHQNRCPTVCRIASTKSGEGPDGASFGPMNDWQHL